MDRIVLFILCVILSACASRKCERFQKKHPECYKTVTDTINWYDTITAEVVVPEILIDTFWDFKTDTFRVYKDKLKVNLFADRGGIRVDAQYEGDTIIKEIPYEVQIPFEVEVPVYRVPDFIKALCFILLGAVVVLLLARFKTK